MFLSLLFFMSPANAEAEHVLASEFGSLYQCVDRVKEGIAVPYTKKHGNEKPSIGRLVVDVSNTPNGVCADMWHTKSDGTLGRGVVWLTFGKIYTSSSRGSKVYDQCWNRVWEVKEVGRLAPETTPTPPAPPPAPAPATEELPEPSQDSRGDCSPNIVAVDNSTVTVNCGGVETPSPSTPVARPSHPTQGCDVTFRTTVGKVVRLEIIRTGSNSVDVMDGRKLITSIKSLPSPESLCSDAQAVIKKRFESDQKFRVGLGFPEVVTEVR